MTRRAIALAPILSLSVALSLATSGCGGDDTAAASESSSSEPSSSSPTSSVDTTATTLQPDTSAGETSPADTTNADASTGGSTSGSTGPGSSDSSSSDGGTDTGGPIDPGLYVECENDIPAAPAGAVCGVTAGSSTMLLRGMVLAGHRIYETGTVLVDGSQANGRILCVGCDCADEPQAAGATVVDCADGVISPGLINPHDHITFNQTEPAGHGDERFEHRHEWRLGQNGHTEIDTSLISDSSQAGILYGELRMLLGGATSVTGSVSSNDASGLLRNLDAAGMTEGLSGVDVNYSTFPLGDSSGPTVLAGCDYPGIDGTFNLEDDVYLPHIAEGVNVRANNEFLCMSGAAGGEDLVVGHTSVVHGIGLLAADVQRMAEVQAELVWSPRSNIDLYGVTADLLTFRNLGVAVALGTDWTASGSMNMLRELKCADQLDRDHYGEVIPDLDMWLMATYWAALSQGADDQIGLIRTGHIADLAIFDGSVNTQHRAVIDAEIQDVALVLRGGQPLYGNTSIIQGLVAPADLDGCESIAGLDQCGVEKLVCAELDSGLSVASITAAVDPQAYELFFCGQPSDEPSCEPFRPMEFPAREGVDDGDGDGVSDDVDLCPTVFNPIRELDGDTQADADGDNIGDSCDLCPLDDGENCTLPDLYDRDGDTVIDFDDNCADLPNLDQADGESDGVGDVCDACPDVANPGGGACPTSIYDIKDGSIPLNSAVVLSDVLVTASAPNGFFVQVHPDDADYVGAEFSGLFVYHGGGFAPQPGDRVSVGGAVQDFFGQIQLVTSGDAVVDSAGNDDVPATLTTVAAIVEGGVDQLALEGVVVRLDGLEVSDVTPMGGPGDNNPVNEFEVTGGLRVNDFFYVLTPAPLLGQIYPQLTGVSRWANDFTKLEPRGPQDVPSSLLSFEPGFSYLVVGSVGVVPSPALEVQLSAVVGVDTPVALAYADPAVLSGPAQIVVPAGASGVVVGLDGIGLGTGTVTASYLGTDLEASVLVYDDAAPRVPTLTPESVDLPLAADTVFTVSLNLPAPAGGQFVGLSASPGAAVTLPANVTVLAGELGVDFTVSAIALGAEVITADIDGVTDTSQVNVLDIAGFPELRIIEAYYDHTGGDDQFEWVKLYNGTASLIDLSDYTLAWGGTDFTYGTLALSGMLAPGSCFLVGGPSGNVDSGFPAAVTFDLATDLNPDLQNSGATADGLALFDVAPGLINAGTIPVHAVIYGTDNTSGLPDETGPNAVVDVGDAGPESSIRMFENGTWGIAASPTPLNCLPLP